MQMHEAAEVTQVVGADNANKKLTEGWKLLAVVPGKVSNEGTPLLMYVLGKAASKPEPKKVAPSERRLAAKARAGVELAEPE